MRLGFDLDNVLANLIDPLNDYLNERFDMVFVRETWHTRIIEDLKLDLEEELEKQVRRAAYNAVFDMDFLNDLPPVEGAKGVINFLRKKGHEIYVITSRKSEAFDMSSDWLKKHGIYFDALICTKYKPREAWSLGVRTFVDDDVDILLDFANFRRAKFFCILFWVCFIVYLLIIL